MGSMAKVNSVEGDAQLMREELKNSQDVTIRVRRAEVLGLFQTILDKSFKFHDLRFLRCGASPGLGQVYALQKARMVKQVGTLLPFSVLQCL